MSMKKIVALVLALLLVMGICGCAGKTTGEKLFGLTEPTNIWYGAAGISSSSNNPTRIDPVVDMLNMLELKETDEAGSAGVKMYDLTFEQDGVQIYLIVTEGKVKFEGQWYEADTADLVSYLAENYT